jgi:hypothetical protein
LRERATALGFAHRLRLDSHRRPIVECFNPHKIALVGRGHERKRSHEALTNAQLRPPRIDRGCDKGAMRQRADELLVHDHRHLRGHRITINAENEHQRLSRWREGAIETFLGVCGRDRKQAKQGGKQDSADHRPASAPLIDWRKSTLFLVHLLRGAAEDRPWPSRPVVGSNGL